MIKKILLFSFLFIFLFTGVMEVKATDLPEPGMLPDHPFYFLKSWSEGIGNIFTFGNENKAERFLNTSGKRIAEANALFEKGNSEVAEETLQRYEEQLEKALGRTQRAKEKGINVDELSERVLEATLRHKDVLLEVYERVPEEARQGIERAMEGGRKGRERALESISEEGRKGAKERTRQQKEEIEEKMERLRERGVPIPEEVGGRPEEAGKRSDEDSGGRPEDLPDETPEERLEDLPEDTEERLDDVSEEPEEIPDEVPGEGQKQESKGL